MYRPVQRMQLKDPTTKLDSYICTMESAAMALDFHTLGKLKLWGGNLVAHCGRSASTIIGHGTSLNNAQTAWKYYGQTLTIKSGHTWNDLLADLKAGHGVVLQGDYDQFSLATRCQDSFRGPHAIYLNPEFSSGTNILMQDPLCSGGKFVSAAELKNFAEKLGRTFIGTTKPQKILYAITAAHASAPKPPTPVPAPAPAPASGTIHIKANATVYMANLATNGRIKSWRTQKWGSKPSQAPAKAKTKKRGYIAGSAIVAPVTAGVFKGELVRIDTGVTYTTP